MIARILTIFLGYLFLRKAMMLLSELGKHKNSKVDKKNKSEDNIIEAEFKHID